MGLGGTFPFLSLLKSCHIFLYILLLSFCLSSLSFVCFVLLCCPFSSLSPGIRATNCNWLKDGRFHCNPTCTKLPGCHPKAGFRLLSQRFLMGKPNQISPPPLREGPPFSGTHPMTISAPKCETGEGSYLCKSIQKLQIGGRQSLFGGCQFPFRRLRFSWVCPIEKGGPPKSHKVGHCGLYMRDIGSTCPFGAFPPILLY